MQPALSSSRSQVCTEVACPEGVEPPTRCLKGSRSIRFMFSALTVEAFVNEVGDYAAFSSERNPGFQPPAIEQLGPVLQELKDQRSGEG